MPSITITAGTSGKISLKPVPFVPAASFNVQNNLEISVKVTVDGKDIRIEVA